MSLYWVVKECGVCGEPIVLEPAHGVDPNNLNVFVPPLDPITHNCGSSQIYVSDEIELREIAEDTTPKTRL
jgi:hypothetical protein